MDEVSTILGDPAGFYTHTCDRLSRLGIDTAGFPVSHLAYRTRTYRDYLTVRDALEEHASGNVENVWNGRPISKLLLASPLPLGEEASVDLIELIPPFHRSVYKLGLEHVGFVVGEQVDEFAAAHRNVLTGQQFQSAVCEPYVVRFADFSHAKFYRYSLMQVCIQENRRFDGITHADWEPDDHDAGPYPDLPA